MTETENRLRDALSAAASTTVDIHPLTVPVRHRFRLPLAVVAAVVTVTAVGAGVLWIRQADPRATTAEVAARPSSDPEISVFLCRRNDAFPRCKGKTANRAKVAEALWSRPDVDWIGYEDRREAYAKYRRQPGALKAVTVEDMPDSFRVVPGAGADWNAIAAAARKLPGVSNVVDQRCLTVSSCPDVSASAS
ncbi:permease-like cell division protein FtsX [Streptosporangium saharense]|uniref:permease-like cell division protein FtsX n=1 Tax=Streptosporangium saharense TaxID=1706840 RepID=UPI00331F2B7E